ncbi:threonine-phosphate decarboxylase CobD [Alteribacillus sp. YIM 98480]|uniref:threonine-phosphate decarboxylase CobD n=1 Tax=Alteribacillus sp. YIM 98480 TaxID=2606599 RepID=UPI00131B7175|nr:threonine-phosphate decarboxylase CobD [Alteribacillus sp. YIM 98480]
MSWPEHGAMPAALSKQLSQARCREIIDFSVNTNPFGPPADLKRKLKEWTDTIYQYTDPSHCTLREHMAEKISCKPDHVLPGNGGAELIFAAARLFANKKVVLIEPTFTEYKQALQANGAEVISFYTNEETRWQWSFQHLKPLLEKSDGIWFCHPNNPTGSVSAKEDIVQLLTYCRAANKLLVVDEAFYDFQQDPFLFHRYIKGNDPIILLRSMTKMYAVPGLRLGYMLASENLIEKINNYLPPWNVNSIAEQAMSYLLNQEAFVNQTVQRLHKEKNRVLKGLQTLKEIEVFPSAVNFYLIRHIKNIDMRPLLTFLAQEGIHARHTYHFPGLDGKYLRLAVKTKSENDQLLQSLARWSGGC